MAPTAPKKRTSMRAKVHKPTVPRAVQQISATPSSGSGIPFTSFDDDGFSTTKKDKRLIKHSSFVNRISKANAPKSDRKRRRPSKKLVTTLESLADALPDTSMMDDSEQVIGQAKIKHRSLKSRPGAMKKREKLETAERERFGKNMALLVVGSETATAMEAIEGDGKATTAASAPANRWAALRGFISQTMEQKPEFLNK